MINEQYKHKIVSLDIDTKLNAVSAKLSEFGFTRNTENPNKWKFEAKVVGVEVEINFRADICVDIYYQKRADTWNGDIHNIFSMKTYSYSIHIYTDIEPQLDKLYRKIVRYIDESEYIDLQEYDKYIEELPY